MMHRYKGVRLPCLTALSVALGCSVWNTQGQNLSDNNSSLTVNPSSQSGISNWTVDGMNYLAQQWFWYRLDSGAQSSINTLTLTGDTVTGGDTLALSYNGAGFTLGVNLLLQGGTPGSGLSTLNETIVINNTSGTNLPISLYQYSQFQLGGVQNITLSPELGKYVDAYQTGNGINVSETDVAPGADEGEANTYPNTLNSLNSGSKYVLNNNSSITGANVTWAFEWDRNLASGGSLSISKTISLTVPEPSAIAIMSLSLGFWALRRRRA